MTELVAFFTVRNAILSLRWKDDREAIEILSAALTELYAPLKMAGILN